MTTRYLEMALSKDAHTFTDWRKAPLPDWGDYNDPMPTWRRLGTSRQFSAKLRCTEPCVVTLIALEIQAG